MGLNSKRGQLSIEMVILILATLLGGALLSAELTKNSGSHEEISDVKKKVFAGVITTNIENNAVKGTYATFETGYTVTDEADDTANDEEFEGIAIVPGNGDNVEFLIICNNSEELAIYFLNNGKGYGTSALYADVGKGFVGISNWTFHDGLLVAKGSDDSFTGYATYIYVKAKGSSKEVLGTYGNPVELEAEDIENPIKFKIFTDGNGYGKYYISILTNNTVVVSEDETNGKQKGKNN